jgi:hypothetical protein
MVKRTARGEFAGLDQHGHPTVDPGESRVLCLTASHRELLQRLGRADESPSAPPSPTRKLSKVKTPSQQDRQQKEAKEDRQQKEPNPTGTPSKIAVSKLEGETTVRIDSSPLIFKLGVDYYRFTLFNFDSSAKEAKPNRNAFRNGRQQT